MTPRSELWVLVQVTLPCWASGHLPMARGGWPRSSTPLGVCKSPKCLQSTGLGGREENDQEAREGSGNAPAHGGPRNTAPIRTRRPYTEEGSPSSPYKPPPCWTAFQPMTTTGGTFVPHENNEKNVPQGPRFMNTSTQICKTGTATSRECFFSGYHVPGRSLSLRVCELLTHTTTLQVWGVSYSQLTDEEESEGHKGGRRIGTRTARPLRAILEDISLPGEPPKFPSESDFPEYRISLNQMLGTGASSEASLRNVAADGGNCFLTPGR